MFGSGRTEPNIGSMADAFDLEFWRTAAISGVRRLNGSPVLTKCCAPHRGNQTKHRQNVVTGRYHNTSSVSDMLCSVDWRSLEQREVDSRLSVLFKIQHHLVAIDEESYLKRGTGRREHQYRQLRADKDYTRFSFFPRTVIHWNEFPSHICLAESLNTFKTQVTKIEHSRHN